MINIKCLETYGFAEADLLSRKTKLKTYRRSLLRGKLNALSKKPFEKWHRQSLIRVNSCVFVVNSLCLSALVAKICINPCNPRLIISVLSVTSAAKKNKKSPFLLEKPHLSVIITNVLRQLVP